MKPIDLRNCFSQPSRAPPLCWPSFHPKHRLGAPDLRSRYSVKIRSQIRPQVRPQNRGPSAELTRQPPGRGGAYRAPPSKSLILLDSSPSRGNIAGAQRVSIFGPTQSATPPTTGRIVSSYSQPCLPSCTFAVRIADTKTIPSIASAACAALLCPDLRPSSENLRGVSPSPSRDCRTEKAPGEMTMCGSKVAAGKANPNARNRRE
jgi:hypothetical protein